MNTHTDLAIELKEQLEEAAPDAGGYTFEEHQEAGGQIRISRVQITNEIGEQQFGRKRGTYITIEVPQMHQAGVALHKRIVSCVVKQIQSTSIWNQPDILLVGIGNREITSDALGPCTVSATCVNRHRNLLMNRSAAYNVSALVPGVMSQTGMESLDIIKGVISQTHPKLLIVVDALASRSMHRVNRTIQISDTGISPGSGLKNYRLALDREALGIPVLAIGVPTVVSTVTILSDMLEGIAGGKWKDEILASLPPNFSENGSDMFVTTKNIDEEIQCLSLILSHAIEECYGLTGAI